MIDDVARRIASNLAIQLSSLLVSQLMSARGDGISSAQLLIAHVDGRTTQEIRRLRRFGAIDSCHNWICPFLKILP